MATPRNPEIMQMRVSWFSHNEIEQLLVQNEAEQFYGAFGLFSSIFAIEIPQACPTNAFIFLWFPHIFLWFSCDFQQRTNYLSDTTWLITIREPLIPCWRPDDVLIGKNNYGKCSHELNTYLLHKRSLGRKYKFCLHVSVNYWPLSINCWPFSATELILKNVY